MSAPTNKETLAPERQLGHRWLGWMGALVLVGLALGLGVVVFSSVKANPSQLWTEATADYTAGQYDQAASRLEKLARLRAPAGLDDLLRAEVELGRGHIEQALTYFGRVPDTDPLAARARLRMAQVERHRHRIRAAEEALLHALRLDPNLVQARRELVYVYGIQLRRKEFHEQFLALSELIPLKFDDVFTWCLLGCANVIWEAREVSTDFVEFVEADPDDRWSRLALVETLRQQHQLDKAQFYLSAMPDSDPDARALRAQMAIDRGDDETTERLLAAGPADHPQLARLRGQLAFIRKDWTDAVHHLRLAYATEPDNRSTLFMLGRSLQELGDEKDAKSFLEAAANQDRLNALFQIAATFKTQRITVIKPEVMHEMAVACAAANRVPEARAWYRLALMTDPLDREAQQGLFRLNKQASESKESKQN